MEYAAEKDNQVAEIKDEIKNAQARIDEIVVEKDQLTKLKESVWLLSFFFFISPEKWFLFLVDR